MSETLVSLIDSDVDYEDYAARVESESTVRPINHWTDSALDLIASGGYTQFGDPLPWIKTHENLRFRPGEVTVWGGINHSGKSLVLGQVMLWLAPTCPVFIASMEMKPEATIRRIALQAAGTDQPSRDWAKRFLSHMRDQIWIYDQTHEVQESKLFGAIAYAAEEKSCRHVVIDNLAMVVKSTDDYTGQKGIIAKASLYAKNLDVHVHIVHHLRKGNDIDGVPDRWALKGAGEISDLADNVILVHRNRRKEQAIARGDEDVDHEEYDALLIVDKQRHGDFCGRFALWFDKPSGQYVPRHGAGPMPWPSPERRYDFDKVAS